MLYRPNYCCQCGEKIVRARWTALTSRRFCEFCEVEQKEHELLPRAVIVVALLVGAAGLTSFLRSEAPSIGTKSSAQITELKSDAKIQASPPQAANHQRDPVTPSEPANSKQRPASQNTSTEAVHYCGALTKKGTPCTRRVKTKGRCWQHIGQPAAEDFNDRVN